MTERKTDWERWQDEWRLGGSSQANVTAALRQLAKARRELFLTWMIESAIGSASLLLIIFALRHAASPFEAGLGLAVGVSIAIVWVQRIIIRQREHASDVASSAEYLVAIRSLRRRQMRLAQFIWIALAFELVFLIPWWVIGSRVHSRRITNIGSLLTMWVPILGFAALFVWSLRLALRARRETREIDRVSNEDGEQAENGPSIM